MLHREGNAIHRVTHRISTPSLRMALADFIRSFVHESVPVALLPNKKHAISSLLLCDELEKVQLCAYYNSIRGTRSDLVCASCGDGLLKESSKFVNVLLSRN